MKLAFEDDRKRKAFQDKLDRERRIAREIAATERSAAGSPSESPPLENPVFLPDEDIRLQEG